MKPKLLDLFCGAGGCAVGYHRAGFDVVGVDIKPQPRYPFPFIEGDALDILDALMHRNTIVWNEIGYGLFDFAVIHASPPCQAYSRMNRAVPTKALKLIPELRERFATCGHVTVIENVEGSELQGNVLMLCGTMFGLKLRRHRLFEISEPICFLTPPCDCRGGVASGRLVGQMLSGKVAPGRKPRQGTSETERPRLFGVPWMNPMEARQSIPPAYTEYIGKQLMTIIGCG